jgi:hypothetical protein
MIRKKYFLFNSCRALLWMGIVSIALSSIVSCKNDPSSNLRFTEKELDIEKLNISNEDLALENSYNEMLQPISALKLSHPKIYWFIVSWLGTNYRTPKWTGYSSDGWQEKTKTRGIDCSGFARVMQDKIFNKRIRGGSQGILNRYCIPISAKELELGDLVFFRAPGAKGKRIVHMGVYLVDGYFVHATSAKSAINGLGLNVNSLNEKMWSEDFVTGGKIKAQKK